MWAELTSDAGILLLLALEEQLAEICVLAGLVELNQRNIILFSLFERAIAVLFCVHHFTSLNHLPLLHAMH